MNEIADVTTSLTRVDDGLWVSERVREVSYPADGHQSCFAVEDRSFWFRHRNEVITRLVATHAPGETLFDIGGGNGFVSLALQRAGIRSVVVEPGVEGIRRASARGLRLLVHSTFEDAGFRPASVGAFGLFDVLEHVEDDGAFLRALHVSLRHGGCLFVTVPACPALWSFEDDEAKHYRRYGMRTLAQALRASGFAIRYCSYFFAVLAPTVLFGRAIPSRLGLRRRVLQTTIEREHTLPGGVFGRLFERGLNWETSQIGCGKRMLFGSSCIAVGQRE